MNERGCGDQRISLGIRARHMQRAQPSATGASTGRVRCENSARIWPSIQVRSLAPGTSAVCSCIPEKGRGLGRALCVYAAGVDRPVGRERSEARLFTGLPPELSPILGITVGRPLDAGLTPRSPDSAPAFLASEGGRRSERFLPRKTAQSGRCGDVRAWSIRRPIRPCRWTPANLRTPITL